MCVEHSYAMQNVHSYLCIYYKESIKEKREIIELFA